MSYKQQLESITTFPELFDFRDALLSDEKKYSDSWQNYGKGHPDSEDLAKCQNANFYLKLVNERIEYLTARGFSLDKIQNPKEEKTPLTPSLVNEG